MTMDKNGVWTGESVPQDEGFHYYQIWLMALHSSRSGTKYYYGAGRWESGIEIPANDKIFYELKNSTRQCL